MKKIHLQAARFSLFSGYWPLAFNLFRLKWSEDQDLIQRMFINFLEAILKEKDHDTG
jgi:hypothetical protein